ncbi:hypothetical protein SLS62_010708 [Diatrype stigma]|uniref:EthD domain-containing protein n=1 Tax=Diatrype stigma TaxID=117547 RepID=A0AAN9YGF8_9PEZI
MTYNVLVIGHRLPHVTPAAFQHYYDKKHIPLVQALTGARFPLTHTRRYVQRTRTGADEYSATVFAGSQADVDYDVLAEMAFESEDAFRAFVAILREEENARAIEEDEKHFFDRSRVRTVLLGETDVTVREGGA